MRRGAPTMGSLFDGSGGFPLAGVMSGVVPVWASEIEPYPIAVTRSRFPQMIHLGNVTEINGRKVKPVDIITFGSPCQDMSIAGKRAGMKHESRGDEGTTRSGLFYEAVRIIREMREETHGRYPTFAVWENVPGAFSSNGGEDFRCVLEELAKICETGGYSVPRPSGGKWKPAGEIVGDGFSIAWRMLDAQYWGVPQRRSRIYLVADFRGRRAGKILFERESLRWRSAASGTERENVAEDAEGSAGRSGGARCLNPWDCQSKRIYQPDGAYPTLPAMGDGARNNQAVVYALQGNGIDRADSAGCNGRGWREDVCYTLNTIDRPAICFKAGQGARTRSLGESETVSPTLGSEPGSNSIPAVCYDARGNGDGIHSPTLTGDHENRITDYTTICVMAHGQSNAEIAENLSPTLTCNHEQPIAAYGVDCRNGVLDKEKTHTLQAKASGGQSLNCTPGVLIGGKPPRKYIIRRLTPLECNRLQGFPDGWGALEHKESMSEEEAAFWENARKTRAEVAGKPYRPCASRAALLKWYNKLHTDSAEYRMWGNGIALPNAYFVISGCAEELSILKEGAEDE
nr:MAG TPA: Cytosine specific methyltransferase [Caudoviricetes sp.]